MATTLATFKNAKRLNYCTLPTIDVEILPDIYLCDQCDEPVEYDKGGGTYGLGKWSHVNADAAEHSGWHSRRPRCRYCYSQDAKYRQHAWYDAVECDRCGGVDGYAIGD